MPIPKVVIVNDNGGDWMGIYADGKLLAEGHSIEVDDALTLLNIPVDVKWVDVDDRLPMLLKDLA